MTRIIRIDATANGNFELRFVGSPNPARRFTVKPADYLRFVAYLNGATIDYQILFKSADRTPFTGVSRIDMPHGGVTEAFAVTTIQSGSMPFTIRIPSLGLEDDPDILVEGATMMLHELEV